MAIGNLNNKISQSDADRVRDIRNPPEFEPGFEGGSEDTSGGFDDLFGSSDQEFSFDDLGSSGFGTDTGSPAGQPNTFGQPQPGGFGQTQPNGFGQPQAGGFGQPLNGFGQPGFPNPFTQQGQTQAQEPPKPDFLDKAIEASGEAAMSFSKVIVEFVKSIKNRNADDFGYLSRNLILTGLGCTGLGIVVGIIGTMKGSPIISFSGFPAQFIGAGLLTLGAGLAGLGFSAIKIAQSTDEGRITVGELPDVSDEIEDDATSDYEENVGDILDDLFGDSDDSDIFGDDDSEESSIFDEQEEEPEPVFAAPVKVDFREALDNVIENQYISREVLFNTFRPFFPCNTPTFADKHEIDSSSTEFNTLETIALKALSNVAKCELEDVKSHLESAVDTYFSYELRLQRIRGINKVDDIAREMEAYFRESSSDTSVNATVDIEGDFYKVVITKGESAVVTIGDLLRQQYVCDFILDTGNKLPMVSGISELGEVVLNDAKIFDTMLIAGKPRSGKSWYVLSILIMLSLFNTPEDVQFIVVDPKESNLFNTFALLPHVAGLHNDKNILDIMDDIIVNEGDRRKKLLSDNKCDDIWALRKKGIKLPVLYLVIDEYITVRNNLGELDKELDKKLQVIISQLPSQGIRLLFVPHRATGVVNKTNRTMLQFTAAVRADVEDVKDTLGINKWNRSLTKPGDIAIKTSASQNAMYVRGAAITTSDDDNADLIKNAAKAFYKMGVDIPDMSNMRVACNRDEEHIREELSGEGTRVQYNAINLFKDE